MTGISIFTENIRYDGWGTMEESAYLLTIVVLSIFLLLLLVIIGKVHAFLSLLLVSVFVGLASGMPFKELLSALQKGMGDILGFIAVVVGLGAIIGKMMEVSGSAQTLARYMIVRSGEKNISRALAVTGFIVCIPVFFEVGFIILIPVLYALTERTGKSILYYGIPLLAGMTVSHAFVPPTPGPMAVAQILDVPLGWMVGLGILTGLPVVLLVGPLYGKRIGKKIVKGVPDFMKIDTMDEESDKLEDFRMILFIILLPLLMMLAGTISEMMVHKGFLSAEYKITGILRFLGHPFSALALTTLIACYFMGYKKGFSAAQIMELSDKALIPAGLIILIVGAAGMFKEILVQSGAGQALAEIFIAYKVAPIFMAYLLAGGIRVVLGSVTVAMVTAAGMMAPVVAELPLETPEKTLIALSIAAGATVFSHVNASGFWLVKKYLDLTEKETLQSWSMTGTLVSVVGFLLILVLSLFF